MRVGAGEASVEAAAEEVMSRIAAADGSGKRYAEQGASKMAILDWSQCPAVESIPGKVSGAWVFRGTRMPVQTVFENLEAGMSPTVYSFVLDTQQ